MLDDLREIYQETILDHGRRPRNHRKAEGANRHAQGNNPMCGDILEVHLVLDEAGVIRDVAFEGNGCAISIASASLMTEVLKGKTAREARTLFERFHAMCTKDEDDPEGIGCDDLERLRVLAGVRAYPMRVKCATLAWHTMNAAMSGEATATTE